MVTDALYNFTSPAGRECTVAAARFAAVNPSSTALVLGCGSGAGAVVLAKEFRSKALAVDSRDGLAREAVKYCEKEGVSHLVTVADSYSFEKISKSDEPFDLIIAEGGYLTSVSRTLFFENLSKRLALRGWAAFSDKIYTSLQIPSTIQKIFGKKDEEILNEEFYRDLIKEAGLDLQYIGLVPASGWDNYYAHMARRLTDMNGYYGDQTVKKALHKEINQFYKLDCLRHLGYLFCIVRKN
ncbi:MAG: class I SAM-dependent methyltransferase [Chitinispirillia bacterium]|nr:class I SAM-dependent methyltransferase [Chitinispirillia bacterium]